jgi:rhamnosyltransferase
MSKNISSAVVLYNPDQNVLTNIGSYLDEVDKLYAVDNSEHKNNFLIEELQKNKKIKYIDNGGNRGIAHALNVGAREAIKDGYDFLLTMDQDSRFPKEEFKKYLKEFLQISDEKVALVSPLHDSYRIDSKNMPKIEEPFTIITSGNIIDLDAWKEIGGFDEDLFIDGVDWDYCIKLRKKGYKIVRFNSVSLNHNLGISSDHKNIFGKNVTVYNHNKIRRYYMTRNRLYLAVKYSTDYPRFSLSTLKTLLVDIKNILFYEKNKSGKLKYMIKGLWDFLMNKFGKIYD